MWWWETPKKKRLQLAFGCEGSGGENTREVVVAKNVSRPFMSPMTTRPPGSSPYVCAKIAYLRGRKSQYSSLFLAYLRPISENFEIFLSIYSIFEAM